MRESRTDERLDGPSGRVDDLAHRMDAGFGRLDGELHKIERTMFNGVIALSASMLAGFAAIALMIAG